jgi:C4-dicarboxylate-binding protein DctP
MTQHHIKRSRLAAAVLGGAVALSSTVALAQTKIIMSNDTSQKSLKGQTFDFLKKELETRLGAKIATEMHHSGTLFNQKTQVQGLQLGSVHLIAPAVGIYSPVAPKIGVMLLPFMLGSPDAIDEAMQDPTIRAAFIPDLEKKNIVPVAVWMNGARSVGHRGQPAGLTPDLWKGKKIRVQSAPVYVETFKAIGANVVPMNWSEVPTALQTGVIDAAEPTGTNWKSAGLWQLVDHIVLNEYTYDFYIVGANKQWWEGMSADVKKGVQDSLKAATKWNWDNEQKANADAYKWIMDKGTKVHKLTKEQKAAWQKAMAPVWSELGDKVVGDKVMAKLKEISAKH